MLGDHVEIPANFDPNAYSGAFRERSGQAIATFEISPRTTRWFGEYYPVRKATTGPDGWRSIEIAYGKPQWVASLVLSLGDEVRAVAPTEVAAATRTLAAEILKLYA
jgi:predicted DNA-binding transcriptional regulator YafY